MASKHKSSAYEYFALSSDLKYYLCQCIISEDGEEGIVMKKLEEIVPFQQARVRIPNSVVKCMK